MNWWEEDILAKELKVERVEDISLWDSFVSSSPQGTVFSTSRWLNAASVAQGGEPIIVGVWKDGKLAAGVSYVSIARGPFKKATTPVMTPYGGIIYRSAPGKRSSEAGSFNMTCAGHIIEYLSERYNHVFLVHAPGFQDLRPFTWAGWTDKVQYTYVMDITDTEKLWGLLERRVRTVIRNAESSLTLGGPIDTAQFAGLYERIYSDRRQPLPYSSEIVAAFVDEIIQSDMAEMRTVRDGDGNVISAMILVYPESSSESDEGCVYSWISGSIPGENTAGAFSLLFWDAVKRHSGTHERLDMVGANISSIAFFKKGFAGTLTPYYVTEYYSSIISRLSFNAFTRAKRYFKIRS